ncbi:hypothetical protein GQ600_969 [Phytophthora cactorum]|nr:hypothetical protein GQ600_969 [Phytophthora cactorum]
MAPGTLGDIDSELSSKLVSEFGYTEVLAVQVESNRIAAMATAAREGNSTYFGEFLKVRRKNLWSRSGLFVKWPITERPVVVDYEKATIEVSDQPSLVLILVMMIQP